MAASFTFILLLSLLLLMQQQPSRAFSAPQPAVVKSDLAVVGCGVLGTSLCEQLLADPTFAGRTVVAVTKSTTRHGSIRERVLGAESSSSDDDDDGDYGDRFILTTMDDLLLRIKHSPPKNAPTATMAATVRRPSPRSSPSPTRTACPTSCTPSTCTTTTELGGWSRSGSSPPTRTRRGS